ncbi:MAG TPA: ECF-type sigma factor [Rhodanobacteraceae bacterium]|nr:ECF-type sigma factor [Rhodanobacteraceae bacterium]
MEAPDITQLLGEWRLGNAGARDQLVQLLYPELRRQAQQVFRRESACQTLQPTALVHEAWLRLSGHALAPAANDRSHLLAITARLMREILVDHARRRNAIKRDGGLRVSLSDPDFPAASTSATPDMLSLDRALEQLETVDAVKARVVELRYFGGLSVEETGTALELSPATVKRHWQAARVWLFNALNNPPEDALSRRD